MSDGGKGSAQRPIADRKKFEENWDAIFNKSDRHITNNRSVLDSDDYGHVHDGSGSGDGVCNRKETWDCGGAQHGSEDKPSE